MWELGQLNGATKRVRSNCSRSGCASARTRRLSCPRSAGPIRYGTGEIVHQASDASSGGFGIPWGHTRSFLSRMYVDADIGQGYDWQVAEWPYLNSYTAGQLAFMGQAGKIVWFDQVGGANT